MEKTGLLPKHSQFKHAIKLKEGSSLYDPLYNLFKHEL